MAMSGFICHDDYLSKTSKLTDEEVGRLFRALMTYHATGEELNIEGRESIAFDFIREDIDRTEQAYKSKCEKNRENRLSAIDNNRQRSSTSVNVCSQKEKEKEKEKDKENNKGDGTRFTRPTKEEIFDFCLDNNIGIDVDRFFDYYTSNGWKVGKNPMKDWKATVRNWARDKKEPAKPKVVPAQQYAQRDYSDEQGDALRRMLELGTG